MTWQAIKGKNALYCVNILLGVAIVAVSTLFLLRAVSDPDFFWHLKTGEWIWQNKELHERITEVMVEVEGRGNQQMRGMVTVFIEELDPQNASMGGRQATEEFVKKITGR